MAFPIKTCVVCGDEFELRPDKPGFANRCPDCTEEEAEKEKLTLEDTAAKGDTSLNAERRKAIRDLLYRNES